MRSPSPHPKKKRVLVFNHFAAPRGSFGGMRHIELFKRLTSWDPCIVAADRNLMTGKKQPSAGPSFRTVPTTPLTGSYLSRVINWCSYAAGAFFLGLLDNKRPAVVFGSSPHLLAGVAAWGVARLRGARFVLEVRDIWPLVLSEMGALRPTSATYRALEVVEKFLYTKADSIVILAEGTAQRIAECGVERSKIVFIPNGAEPSEFIPSSPRGVLRRRLSVSGLVLVYAGAHGEANGLGFVLDAARELQDDGTDVRIVLVGNGPEKEKLVRRASIDGLGNVVFLDPVPKGEIPDILGAADVGLHVLADVPLFRYGVSPNKVHDYMAAGLPVLTNTPGTVGRLVEEAGAGICVEPDQLAAGVRRMADAGDAQRIRWGDSGKRFIEETRSRANLARRLERALNDVTSGERIG
jgi:glycosyltransferase involved in cell wall biosynthesis